MSTQKGTISKVFPVAEGSLQQLGEALEEYLRPLMESGLVPAAEVTVSFEMEFDKVQVRRNRQPESEDVASATKT